MTARLEAMEAGAPNRPEFTKTPIWRHLERYGVFYAFILIVALLIWLVPTRDNTGSNQAQQAGQIAQSDTGSSDTGSGSSAGSATAAGNQAAGAGAAGSNSGTAGGYTNLNSAAVKQLQAQIVPWAWNKSGKTIGGFDCKPGIRQIPWSAYADPCYPHVNLSYNGGATSRGVTSDKIVIVSRHFMDSASSQAVNAFVAQAGFATGAAVTQADNVFRKYFEKIYELWGRKVQYIDWTSPNGNSTNEALGQGADVACSDADTIIAKYHPFMVVGTGNNPGATGVFAVCAAQRHLMTYGGGAYLPEWWFQNYHP
jgi:hypothetical protein